MKTNWKHRRNTTTELASFAIGRGQTPRLTAVAARLGISRSRLVREHLERLLETYEARPREHGAVDATVGEAKAREHASQTPRADEGAAAAGREQRTAEAGD